MQQDCTKTELQERLDRGRKPRRGKTPKDIAFKYPNTGYQRFIRLMKLAEFDDFTRPWSDYPCIEFYPTHKNKYGRFKVHGAEIGAHRASLEMKIGRLPEGIFALHRCDNRPCIRQIHLFPGTPGENMADMAAKGRAAKVKGEERPSAKLKGHQVIEMRELYKTVKNQHELARMFSINVATVHSILHRKTWAHI